MARSTPRSAPDTDTGSGPASNGRQAPPATEPYAASPAATTPVADHESAAALVAAELAATRRRWPFLLAGLVIGATAAVAVVAYLDRADEADEAELQEELTLSTAPVESRDLLEEVEWAGTLQYGEPVSLTGAGGTITAASPLGTAVERGGTIAAVDEEPVVVFYGDRPLWRSVRSGVEGPDVFLVETNLVALGYDPDVTVTVDGEFTANTAAMIERWQADIGNEVTGTVEVGDVVVTSGPAVITGEAEVGASAQGPLASVSSQRTVTDVVSAVSGTVTGLAAVGTAVEHGTVLHLVDEVPVVAVSAAEVAADPVLDVLTSATFTELELEQALADAGHDPEGEMTVDGSITSLTTAAIERWQGGAGLPVSGVAEPGHYRVMPVGHSVDHHLVADGEVAGPRPVLTTSTSELRIEVVVAVAEADEFDVGQSVVSELADETIVDGTVAEIGIIERETPQSDPTVTIVIEVIAGSDQELVEGNVTVTTISEAIEGATAVPTRALVSLAEGGFAVEVVESDGETRLVGVELGAFDDGYVEVTSGDVSVGDDVVVPGEGNR